MTYRLASFRKPTSLSFSNYFQRMPSSSFTPTPRIQSTLDPIVGMMGSLVGEHQEKWNGDIMSLAQGLVYWTPPEACVKAMQDELAKDPLESMLHIYTPDKGISELREALQDKVMTENGLKTHEIIVTSGANQAFLNCVLTMMDTASEKAIAFRPFYFNHVMAWQMTLNDYEQQLLFGPTNESTGIPDIDWLRKSLQDDPRIRMVTLVNPGNPTGTLLSRELVQEISDLCREHDCWLVLDATYEYFINDGSSTTFDGCIDAPHVVHIFSFSKAYALAGYRCGYAAVHKESGLAEAFSKVQDTVPISACRLSQVSANAAVRHCAPAWVQEKIASLKDGREAIREAISVLGTNVMGGSGAIYFFVQLPVSHRDDTEVATMLVRDYGVAVIPGKFCGAPGWLRVCYANLPPKRCEEAAKRLKKGLSSLVVK